MPSEEEMDKISELCREGHTTECAASMFFQGENCSCNLEERKQVAHNCGADSHIGAQDYDPNGRFFQPK